MTSQEEDDDDFVSNLLAEADEEKFRADVDYDDEEEEEEGFSEKIRDQDRFLPIANVGKVMKDCLPSNSKMSKDSKMCIQECVSEFVSFVTSEAAERCHLEKRKTVNGEDILFAMSTLGFDSYVEPLNIFLTRYRETIKSEKMGIPVPSVPENLVRREEAPVKVALPTRFIAAPPTILHDVESIAHVTNSLVAPPQHQQQMPVYTAAYQPQGDQQPQVHYSN